VKAEEAIKLFVVTNQLVEHDLDKIESDFQVDLGRDHRRAIETDETYYPQIAADIRAEAARMAPHYEIFYSLETTIRVLIADSLDAAEPEDWWAKTVPDHIRRDAQKRRKHEVDTGMTPRSESLLDFTNFGELSEIIKANWDVFGSIFSSAKAVERVLSNLNTLRGPIAHCSPLAEDEVLRLRLSVRDWYRLME
jgi:Swt1-like HEPN